MSPTPTPTSTAPTNKGGYTSIKAQLLSHPHKFSSPPNSPLPHILPKPQSDSPLSSISSLSLHPTLESTLHILNRDLPSAHFLLRHAQASPAWESMYLHGILHRIEGDIDNARAWYGDVEASDVFASVWRSQDAESTGAKKRWEGFLDRVERWRDSVRARKGSKGSRLANEAGEEVRTVTDWEAEEKDLNETSLWELKRVLEFCEAKFGVNAWDDARSEYTMLGKKKGDIASNMIMGGEGWREF